MRSPSMLRSPIKSRRPRLHPDVPPRAGFGRLREVLGRAAMRATPIVLAGGAAVHSSAHAGDFAAIASQVLSGQHPVFDGQIANGERFGRACSGLGDVDGDGVPDIVVGSRSDQDGGTDAGAVYIVFMRADLTPKAATKIGAASGGLPKGAILAGDMFGYGVAGIGDLDGDGVPDLAVTSPNAERSGLPSSANRGALFVCLLNPDGTVRAHTRLDEAAGLPLQNGDSFGQACAHLGDLDGDGTAEIGVGAPGTDGGAFNAGAAYIVSVTPNGGLARFARIDQLAVPALGPLDASDNFGGRGMAAIGDLDLDGATEIAIGCYRDDDGGLDRGATYVVSVGAKGPGQPFRVEGVRKISATSGGLIGPLADDDLFGMTVAPLGDLDGDGIADLAVGNNKDDAGSPDTGALFLLGLTPEAGVAWEERIDAGTGFPGLSLLAGERFGRALANLGDIRGDGSTVLGVGGGAGVLGGRLWFVVVGSARSADLDANGVVGGEDLAQLLGAWGLGGPTDLDWSGSTDAADLALLLDAW